MELVHSDQAVVERLHTVFINGEAERRMCADQNLVGALQKRAYGLDLAAIVATGSVAEIAVWLHLPVGPKSELGERLIVETCANCALRHRDDYLLYTLIGELVQRDEHQRAALAG